VGTFEEFIEGLRRGCKRKRSPQRTVMLIEALARKDSRTRGEVLAACAGLLASDVEEAKKH
jgi:hypothetical protein